MQGLILRFNVLCPLWSFKREHNRSFSDLQHHCIGRVAHRHARKPREREREREKERERVRQRETERDRRTDRQTRDRYRPMDRRKGERQKYSDSGRQSEKGRKEFKASLTQLSPLLILPVSLIQ